MCIPCGLCLLVFSTWVQLRCSLFVTFDVYHNISCFKEWYYMSKVIHCIFIPTFIARPKLFLWNFVLSHIASGLLPDYEYSDICRLLDFHLDIFFNPFFFMIFFQTLSSSIAPLVTSYAVGILRGDQVTLIALFTVWFFVLCRRMIKPHCELHLYFSLTKFKSKNLYMPLDLFVVHVLFSMGAFGCLQQEMTAISGCMKQMLQIICRCSYLDAHMHSCFM